MGEDITAYFATNRNLDQTDPPEFGEVFHRDGAEFYRVGKATTRRDAAASGQAMARLFLRLRDFLTAEARRTPTAADDDARAAHRPCPNRLGSNGPEDMARISPRVTAVDCREVDWTGLLDATHQYYRQRPEVIADANSVLAGNLPSEVKRRTTLPERGRYRIWEESHIDRAIDGDDMRER